MKTRTSTALAAVFCLGAVAWISHAGDPAKRDIHTAAPEASTSFAEDEQGHPALVPPAADRHRLSAADTSDDPRNEQIRKDLRDELEAEVPWKYQDMSLDELAEAYVALRKTYTEGVFSAGDAMVQAGEFRAISQSEMTPEDNYADGKIVVFRNGGRHPETDEQVFNRAVLQEYQYPDLYRLRSEVRWLRRATAPKSASEGTAWMKGPFQQP